MRKVSRFRPTVPAALPLLGEMDQALDGKYFLRFYQGQCEIELGHYEAALARVEALWGAEPDTPEGDELDVLLPLVEAYEEEHHRIELPDPIEAILFRMEQLGLDRSSLGDIIGGRKAGDKKPSRKIVEFLTQKETDALPVGGGAMFMEAAFAIIAFLTATTAFGGWQGYQDAGGAGAALAVFAGGLANFLARIGIPSDFGVAYGSVFLVIMAITIMQLVVRFMRVASAEFLGDRIPVLRNVHVGSIIALVFSAILIWTGFWARIWVLFGGANQLMASLALLIVSLWLMSKAKNYIWAFIPFAFMFITTIAALVDTGIKSFKAVDFDAGAGPAIGNIIAGGLAVILVICALILAWDGIQALLRFRSGAAKPAATGGGE